MFQQALQDALKALDARDRLRLSCYYVRSLTLAETGRLLKEHEATVSRKLARARKQIRREIEQSMKDRHRLTPNEIDLCYQYVVEDGSVDLSGVLDP
jgi:predicted metal-dependent hydrolase